MGDKISTVSALLVDSDQDDDLLNDLFCYFQSFRYSCFQNRYMKKQLEEHHQ